MTRDLTTEASIVRLQLAWDRLWGSLRAWAVSSGLPMTWTFRGLVRRPPRPDRLACASSASRLDKTRPVVVLTREAARAAITKVTVAPITSTVKGLSSEVPVGQHNGLDQDSVISLDNAVTIPVSLLGRTVGNLTSEQDSLLARAVVLAYDLDVALRDS